ncbi:hypothetical protein CXB51_032489 [Gossypium anomalum]|uniref:Integrase catalytic domain-containing protein n=1 Tax=Gossypium anomalum TaxID=47600 RepID=A0A8J5Y3B4_9ROSI|nr:hypothetical protein CXB51_032489 [Gossypium anomalum]
MNGEKICLADSATTHTILKDKRYFSHLIMKEESVSTISGSTTIIEGSGRATIILPRGTKIEIINALYSPKSQRNLLSFKDIRQNGYHIETLNEGHCEFHQITSIAQGNKQIVEKLPAFFTGLCYTKISSIETHTIVNQKFANDFVLWHDRLGHPGLIMMRKIIENSCGHSLKSQQILQNITCAACSLGKLIIRPSPAKINKEPLTFLERIQGDICGPIHPPCGPFRYFMVLIDASSRWSHVSLLSTGNLAFARLLAQLIRLRAHFPYFPIKTIRLDNAGEFTSQSFNNYCMPIGISVEHPVAHVHTQNGQQVIIKSPPLQIVYGQEPNISYLRTFGCVVYVPIAPPHRTKMGPQRRLDCHFDESIFPILGGEIKQLDQKISWKELSLAHLDPRTKQCDLEVQKIIHLQSLVNELPDAFSDPKKVTKSYIPAVNAPIKLDIPEG